MLKLEYRGEMQNEDRNVERQVAYPVVQGNSLI